MKVLAIMRPAGEVDLRARIATHARAELGVVWRLYREGRVREMYSPATPGAVLVLEVASAEAAAALLSTLPLIVHGVMSLDLLELHPFGALEMLFSGEQA